MLAPRQRQCYEFICLHWMKHARAPSQREIGEYLGCQQSHVQRFIDSLVAKGVVEIEDERTNVRPVGLDEHIRQYFS